MFYLPRPKYNESNDFPYDPRKHHVFGVLLRPAHQHDREDQRHKRNDEGGANVLPRGRVGPETVGFQRLTPEQQEETPTNAKDAQQGHHDTDPSGTGAKTTHVS